MERNTHSKTPRICHRGFIYCSSRICNTFSVQTQREHRSKENTWTEKDLTDALQQGEKSRRSKGDGRRREPREDDSGKRRSSERSREETDTDRRRSKQERSGKHREEPTLENEAGSSKGANGTKRDRDRDRIHKERTRDKLKDDDENDSGSNDRTKGRSRRERDGEERRRHKTRDEPSKDEMGHSKERRRRSKDRTDQDEGSRERESREEDMAERRREKEERRKEREKDDRRREGGEGKEEKDRSKREKEKGERSRDKDVDDGSKREKRDRSRERGGDEGRKRDRGERKREQEKSERKRDKERDNKRTEKRREEGNEEDSDRRREKDRSDEMEVDKDERRRLKQERRERREKEKSKTELEGTNKEERRKEKNDRERSDDNKERRRRHEDREKHQEVVEIHSRSLSIQNAAEVDDEDINDDNYGEDNYEDDFEDYEDDFEEADEDDHDNVDSEHDKGKLLEIFEAINAENDDVARPSPYSRSPSENSRDEAINEQTTNKLHKSSREGRINFSAAKQKHVNEFVASKTKKRAKELENLIELDVAIYDIFDLPPLNEYELYIKSYGQSDSKQAYVQCHEDIVEKEMQTEEIEISTKWTQYPPDDFKGCGDGGENGNKDDLTGISISPHSVDSVRLSNFLQQAGQVCLILLEEMSSGRTDSIYKERSDINISDGFIQLATRLSFLEGRHILDINFNSIQTHLLLTAHDSNGPSSGANDDDCLRGKGIVCFWNVNEPTQPQKILFCESSPRSCCFSPIKSSLIFAGLEDGSIVIWDIRESSSLHCTNKDKDSQRVVRRPTFSTAGVFNNENHLSPVQSVLPISLPKESAEASIRTSFGQDEPGGMAFQLASLDENGQVNIWVVIELDKPDDAGSERDLGLAPGGRVKLVKSTSIQVESPHRSQPAFQCILLSKIDCINTKRDIFTGSNVQTSTMQFSTKDSNHFYVSTDRGWVVHCTRYGGRTHPKAYRPDIDCFVTVTAMDVSPWSIPIMLVGCADGSLRLHDLHKEHAIRSWAESTQGNRITQIKWSRSRPSLFYVLDTKSNLYIWDLLQKDGCPVSTEHFNRGRLLLFSISNDYESLGIGLPGRKSELVLNYEGGIVEVHKLKETLTIAQPDELDRFASLVDSFI